MPHQSGIVLHSWVPEEYAQPLQRLCGHWGFHQHIDWASLPPLPVLSG
jgi:hypothetical protein